MLSGIFLEELQTAFAEEWENITVASITAIHCFIPWEFPIPCFTPWSFPITLSFPVYLPLALRCYQVYFWRNCRRLLPKSEKISQEHHWQQECQEQFELSYATGRQSFPIDSSLLPQSEKGKKNKKTYYTLRPNPGFGLFLVSVTY